MSGYNYLFGEIMASIYDIKPAFQNLLRPLANFLATKKITANQVTLITCFLSVCLGMWVSFCFTQVKYFLFMPVWFFLRMAMNAIDGMLAKEHGMKTKLGTILNEITDVVSDSALYFPFLFLNAAAMVPVNLFLLLSVISEMTGVVAVQIGVSRRYDGPLGKSDRAFVIGALALITGLGVNTEKWLGGFFLALVFLLVLTIFNRAKGALQEELVR